MEEYFPSGYDKYATGRMNCREAEMGRRNRKEKYAGRIIGGLAILFLALVIVPIGAVMFVISGLWSAFDRFMLRFGR